MSGAHTHTLSLTFIEKYLIKKNLLKKMWPNFVMLVVFNNPFLINVQILIFFSRDGQTFQAIVYTSQK